jgi:hypothetical protein
MFMRNNPAMIIGCHQVTQGDISSDRYFDAHFLTAYLSNVQGESSKKNSVMYYPVLDRNSGLYSDGSMDKDGKMPAVKLALPEFTPRMKILALGGGAIKMTMPEITSAMVCHSVNRSCHCRHIMRGFHDPCYFIGYLAWHGLSGQKMHLHSMHC